MINLSSTLKKVLSKHHLSETESYTLFKNFPDAPLAQQGAVLALLASKTITAPELLGALRYFLEQSTLFRYQHDVIDIVGTGGDGYGTFNISTAASLVVASQGVRVAKHGGRAASSLTGSVDVMEELRIPLYESPSQIVESLEKHQYAYLCAPYFNPVLKKLAPLRKSLGFHTFFNIVGPLLNPLQPSKLVIGVNCKELIPIVAEVLLSLGKERTLIVCSQEGLDEFSLSAVNYVAEITPQDKLKEYKLYPEDVGLRSYPLADVIGGTPADNANIIRGIFKGQITGAKLDIVLFNAASGFVVSGLATDFHHGVKLALDAIHSGKADALVTNLSQGATHA